MKKKGSAIILVSIIMMAAFLVALAVIKYQIDQYKNLKYNRITIQANYCSEAGINVFLSPLISVEYTITNEVNSFKNALDIALSDEVIKTDYSILFSKDNYKYKIVSYTDVTGDVASFGKLTYNIAVEGNYKEKISDEAITVKKVYKVEFYMFLTSYTDANNFNCRYRYKILSVN